MSLLMQHHNLLARDSTKRAVNGYLYNKYAAYLSNFAPVGWHVPIDNTDMAILRDFLGGTSVAGGKLKETGLTHWDAPNDATNESLFTALGSGYRYVTVSIFGVFLELKNLTMYWSIGGQISGRYPYWYLLNHNAEFLVSALLPQNGMSVRLIKDDSANPGYLIDADGNVYDTVKIGDQVWTKQNWMCTKLNNGTPLTKITDNATWAGMTTEAYCAYANDEELV